MPIAQIQKLIETFPLPRPVKHWVIMPVWRAFVRLSKPEVRIVTGGISFYALFSIFPLIYLTLTLLFGFLPADLSQQLATTVDQVLVSAVAPLSEADLDVIHGATPQGLTVRALLAMLVVLYTASAGAKAAITGIRMVAGSEQRTRIIRFQGVSILLTGALILVVWLLGALQLIASFITEGNGFVGYDVARLIAAGAEALWLGKWFACFLIFYLIIGLSLHGRVQGNWPKALGAASGALVWVGATWGYHLYLRLSSLDTFYGALASVILGFIWLSLSVGALLFGAAMTVEIAARLPQGDADADPDGEME